MSTSENTKTAITPMIWTTGPKAESPIVANGMFINRYPAITAASNKSTDFSILIPPIYYIYMQLLLAGCLLNEKMDGVEGKIDICGLCTCCKVWLVRKN